MTVFSVCFHADGGRLGDDTSLFGLDAHTVAHKTLSGYYVSVVISPLVQNTQ